MPPDQPASTPNPTSPPTAAFLARAIALRSMVPDPGSQGQRAARVRRRGRPKHQITPLARIMVQNAHTNPQLATYLGCGLRTVEYWTTGDKPISNRYIERVCQLYRKPAEFFAYDRDGETITLESRVIAEEFFSYSEPDPVD